MYTLGEQIGRGGYATVYKCSDGSGIKYVCKVLSKVRNDINKIHMEIEIMKRLSFSAHVPKFIDAIENKESFYIIQEWCKGGSIIDYMTSQQGLPVAESTVASIVKGSLLGLSHIHSVDIIHGDVKPANVLLTDKDDYSMLKLCDFGLSMIMPSDVDLLDTKRLKGTPLFMAPENLSRDYSKKSDIWSLGVMTYLLLSNSFPFYDDDMYKLWYEILHKEPDFSNPKWEQISEPAKDFIKACLQKQTSDRMSASECLKHPWLN